MDIGYYKRNAIKHHNTTWYLIDIWLHNIDELESYPQEYWIKVNNKTGVYYIHENLFSMLSLKYAPFDEYAFSIKLDSSLYFQ